jgi:hypothetical protein
MVERAARLSRGEGGGRRAILVIDTFIPLKINLRKSSQKLRRFLRIRFTQPYSFPTFPSNASRELWTMSSNAADSLFIDLG